MHVLYETVLIKTFMPEMSCAQRERERERESYRWDDC